MQFPITISHASTTREAEQNKKMKTQTPTNACQIKKNLQHNQGPPGPFGYLQCR